MGKITPAIPKIRKVLAMLLPIIFPIIISGWFLNEEIKLTTSSGPEVPKETSVNPRIILGILYRFPIAAVPETR